jgi:predicted ATP-grasp superfamily ATP-dependent carboligase
MYHLLREASIPAPRVVFPPEAPRDDQCWLVKPLASAGGGRIAIWNKKWSAYGAKNVYFQEFIDGESYAAAFLGDGQRVRLLGVTRQLVGMEWLNARPFHYCGSIGPLTLDLPLQQSLQQLGEALVSASGMMGLFGVDFILRDGLPWLVEINPRYTSSMEILEHAGGQSLLKLHRSVFDAGVGPAPVDPARSPEILGKAILFASRSLKFPPRGPWCLPDRPASVRELPAFADIPQPGAHIAAGRPVLAFFARAASVHECFQNLQEIAVDLDRRLGVS